MGRFFNTAGPCDPRFHYMIPAEQRLPEARRLVERNGYFVVHAPRQTGKTTTLRALAQALTAEGAHAALLFSCEVGEPAGDDFEEAQRGILAEMAHSASKDLPEALRPPAPWPPPAPASALLRTALTAWAEACPRPLVLIFDEIDALRGDGLLAVLRQLRAGYGSRPEAFPGSVALCGLRDVRDYKAASGGDPERLGTSSPFNIKVESLRIGDLGADEVQTLYAQHTEETGQRFEPGAVDLSFELTAGQPWLVNALAREAVEKLAPDPARPVSRADIERAKERLILARQTHLDSLGARLMEPRVRRIVEPLLAGTLPPADPHDDDFQYTADLGLVAPDPPLRVANPLYREVIARVLAASAERAVTVEPGRFTLDDGRLDVDALLSAFAEFWVEHGEILETRMPYHEVAPQLVLMAFLQRIVNGGGYVDREYGVGRGRIDLLIRWPWPGGLQREALELKVWAAGRPDPLERGLAQLDGYLERLGLDAGALVVFDRRPQAAPVAERTALGSAQTPAGRPVRLLRA